MPTCNYLANFLTICLLCSVRRSYSVGAMTNTTDKYPAQTASIAALEAEGFDCLSNFWTGNDSQDPEDDARAYVFGKRLNRHSSVQVQVDSDGSCNGLSIDDYLARFARSCGMVGY